MDMQMSEEPLDDAIVWDHAEPVAMHVAVLGRFTPGASRCIWICWQDQLQWKVLEAWPFPLATRA
jgi:hypothetical protein